MDHMPQTVRSLVSAAFKTAFSNLPVFIRLAIPLVALDTLAIWFKLQGKGSLHMLFMWAHVFASLFFFISVSRFTDGKPLGDNPTGLTSGGVFGRYLLTYLKIMLVAFLFVIISITLLAGVGYALFSEVIQEHHNLGEPLLSLMGNTQIIAFSFISIILFLSLLMYFTARINPAITAAALGEDSSLSSIWNLTKDRVWFVFRTYFLFTLAALIPFLIVLSLVGTLYFKAFNSAINAPPSHTEQQQILDEISRIRKDSTLSLDEGNKQFEAFIHKHTTQKIEDASAKAKASLAPKTLKESLLILLPSLLMSLFSKLIAFTVIIGVTRLYRTLKNTNRP